MCRCFYEDVVATNLQTSTIGEDFQFFQELMFWKIFCFILFWICGSYKNINWPRRLCSKLLINIQNVIFSFRRGAHTPQGAIWLLKGVIRKWARHEFISFAPAHLNTMIHFCVKFNEKHNEKHSMLYSWCF